MSSNLFAISFSVSNFALFLFSVQTAKRKYDLEKPHKYRIYNKNTIGVQPLGVQIPMVFSYGGGEESRTPVRKSIHKAFYERSLPIAFPQQTAGKQAACCSIPN